MSLIAYTLPLLTASGDGGGDSFADHKPGIKDFWQPLIPYQGDGAWAFTRPSLVMLLTAGILGWFFMTTARRATVVPSKRQWLAEQAYGFVRNTIARDVIGAKDFRQFLPLLFALFTLILFNNVTGIIPVVQFPSTSRIAFPIVLTLIVYLVYNVVAMKRKHGPIGYLKAMVPPGIPGWLIPIIFIIEFATYVVIRPLTLALRLFGNMLAGHLLLLVFFVGGEYLLVQADGIFMKGAGIMSFVMAILMTFFELLVEVLQAFIFTMLAAVYIADAVSEHH